MNWMHLLQAAALGAAPAPAGDLAAMNDEFEAAALSPDWTLFHQAYGWPDKIKALDVGRTRMVLDLSG